MTRGFERSTFLGEPYNKSYYPAQFVASGFAIRKRWFSLEIEGVPTFRKLTQPLERDHAQALKDGYRIDPMDIRAPALVQALHAAVEDSYRDFLGITRIDLDEFREIFAGYAHGRDPRFALAAWSPTGELGGFMIGYPDYARAARALRSHRSPLALLRFWLCAHSAERVVGFMIGITAKESARGHHLGRALAYKCLRSVMEGGFKAIVLALLAEDSPAWLFFEGGRFEAQKEYALYEANLE
jgi:ribosomal protein S18 acetylase RimI-like enzyme